MRVLVCGGRDYSDQRTVFSVLEDLHQRYGSLTIIQGGASGADALAREWCFRLSGRIHLINEPADWKKHGKAAGPIRNQKMLTEGKPDMVVAFPGGRGTADMVRRAKAANVLVALIDS